MRYPDKITVGGITYAVDLLDFPVTHEDYPEMKFQGACRFHVDGPGKRIQVFNNRASPDSTGETFFHEFLEATNFEYELGLEHRAIKTLGMELYRVLKEHGPFILSGEHVPVSEC